MKELSIEEKAKAYDKAIEKGKQIQNTPYTAHWDIMKEVAEHLLPELAESEDERISREITEFLVDFNNGEYERPNENTIDSWLSWLEKQGEQAIRWNKNTNDNKPQKNHSVLIKTTHGIAEGEWQGEQWYQYRWTSIIRDSDVLSWIELSDLEKQGEQKPVDKIEPKFHEGEWITNGACIIKITSVDDRYYWHDNDCVGGDIESIDKEYRLWTIQDVKDGDVLVLNNEVFIYAHRKQMYSIAVAHCFVDSAGSFHLDGEFGYKECGKTISPATKEQRDLLFQKMKEAGYEWDSHTNKMIYNND